MPYDPIFVQPMREELTRMGIKELMTAADVDAAIAQPGTTLVVVNSVCGCAAGGARPAVGMALKHGNLPDRTVTVFAGQDIEATQHLRSAYLQGIPPSSPSIFLMKDGSPVAAIHRFHIEGHSPDAIAGAMMQMFDEFCGNEVSVA